MKERSLCGLALIVITIFASNNNNNNCAVVASGPKSRELSHGAKYATCGDCHCIPEKNANGLFSCPKRNSTLDNIPRWVIHQFKQNELLNPIELNCDPYTDDDCVTDPPQDSNLVALGEEAVCAMKYEKDLNDNFFHETSTSIKFSRHRSLRVNNTSELVRTCSKPGPKRYRLVTYANKNQAEADGAFVTHAGVCGLCSSAQDLAAYLKHTDLQSKGTICALQAMGISGWAFERGMGCFQKLGFTEGCAKIWTLDTYQTRRSCLLECTSMKIRHRPNNGPAPKCKLDGCLRCDEDESGPLFKQFAARTRRRSGLLSMIVRPCNSIRNDIVQIPCP